MKNHPRMMITAVPPTPPPTPPPIAAACVLESFTTGVGLAVESGVDADAVAAGTMVGGVVLLLAVMVLLLVNEEIEEMVVAIHVSCV